MKTNTDGRIALCGFMGAGKTTIGKHLAAMLDYSFIDLDEQIEKKEGCSIKEIFEQEGELAFRKKERQAVEEFLTNKQSVIALGGGALQNQSAVKYIKEKSLLIFIECPLYVILERISGDKKRPLLLDNNGNFKRPDVLKEEFKALYKKRLPYYRRAVITIDGSDYSTPRQAAEALNRIIKKYDQQH